MNSLFETNDFLRKNRPTLIEYAAFYGSIQIFKYLQINNVKLPFTILNYAIHGKNSEIIRIVEENHIKPTHWFGEEEEKESFVELEESIKCHHNEIAEYILENYVNEGEKMNEFEIGLKYYNYAFLPTDFKLLLKLPGKFSSTNINDLNIYKVILSFAKITIPSSFTKIEDSMFKNFGSLKEIVIPDSVTSIGKSSFDQCTSLSQIKIPDSVKSIGDFAFNGCSSLAKIDMSSSACSFGKCAFNGVTSLEITGGIQKIFNNMFENCTSLKQIKIADSVSIIGNKAFSKCISLKQINLPSSLISIGEYAFERCSSLVQIEIPYSVKSIGSFSFMNCPSLTKIEIHSLIISIKESMFNGCTSLAQIEIPSSVTSIGNNAFEKCSLLKEIKFFLQLKLLNHIHSMNAVL